MDPICNINLSIVELHDDRPYFVNLRSLPNTYYLEGFPHELPLRKTEPPLFMKSESIDTRFMTKRATFDGTFPPAYTLASSLIASSCRTCEMYLNVISSPCLQLQREGRKLTASKSPHPAYPSAPRTPDSTESLRLPVLRTGPTPCS